MKKIILAIAALACSMNVNAQLVKIMKGETVVKEYKASEYDKVVFEEATVTPVSSVSISSPTAEPKVNWNTNDKIGIFGEGATGGAAYTFDADAGSFKNASSTITDIQAMMYPYQSTATWANNTLTCEIPTVQTATAGSFDKNAAIMYSIGSSENATLTYAVAFLKVNIPEGTTNVHAITVYSTTALSSKVGITSSGVAPASGSQTYVTLQADNENGAFAAGDYYIAVSPGTLANLSIAYKYTDHTAKAKEGDSSLTLEAGQVQAITVDFTTGTVRAAKQLWENGPYFATEDVGGNNTKYKWGATAAGGSQNNGGYSLNYDTAYKIWGSAWRMLTQADANGIGDNCNKKFNNISYFDITSKTEGYGAITLRANMSQGASNSLGSYWTSTLAGDNKPYCLRMTGYTHVSQKPNAGFSTTGTFNRSEEYGVRAVLR